MPSRSSGQRLGVRRGTLDRQRGTLDPLVMEIFWASGSPFSWRVLLTLEVKGLPYQSRMLEFSKQETRTPEFLGLNPRGLVPVLRDGEVVVSESLAIVAYLDRRAPEPPLFGRTPAEAARVWQSCMETALYLDGPGDRFILPLYRGQSAEPERAAAVRGAISPIAAELTRLEAALADHPYLALDTLSAADLTAYPMVRSLLRAVEKPGAEKFDHGLDRFAQRYPRLTAWMGRIEALPGYQRTFPPHWRQG
jgi:glutathione S-transferase